MSEVLAEQITHMGATVTETGVTFRVWAPHASQVYVIGTFNNWDETSHPLKSEEGGKWALHATDAKVGDEYRYLIHNGEQKLSRIDPYTREVTNSVGNGVISNLAFDWQDDDFEQYPVNEIVIYELHIGTFGKSGEDGKPAGFEQAINDLDYLKKLGVNCIEVMPVAEFAGDLSWGYNPAHIFAVESAYGGPAMFKQFIREAHKRGIAVILDVVYNHFGPSDVDMWQFDGWSENGMGGIYFYNDWRAETPWGNSRPDYGREEVRQMIHDNAMMWLEEFHLDGLRYDMTLFIRNVKGNGDVGCDLPDGWSLVQWVNTSIREKFPHKLTIAEDLQNNDFLTKTGDEGGAAFHAQWDARFVHPIREAVILSDDAHRNMDAVRAAIEANYNGNPFQRVVYSESHDEVANGKARVTSEVMGNDPQHYFAQKKSTLAAGVVFTSPGIPMIFQGQEFLEDEWFRDTVPLDWDKSKEFSGIVQMYRDLINLRLNRAGQTRGLTGSGLSILMQDNDRNLISYQRWYEHGICDDVVVVASFHNEAHTTTINFPTAGKWKCVFNSDSKIYSKKFQNTPSVDLVIEPDKEGAASADVTIGPYTVLVYSLSELA
ncbi:alpha-amylase family glycosyl hydrolase [Lacunimicrobium album]